MKSASSRDWLKSPTSSRKPSFIITYRPSYELFFELMAKA